MSRKHRNFEWAWGNTTHLWERHQVRPFEAEEAITDLHAIVEPDELHSQEEKRFAVIGKTRKHRLLFLVFTIRTKRIRVLHARTAKREEVQLYEEKTSAAYFKDEEEEHIFWENIDLSEYYEAKDFKHFDLEQFLKEHGQPKSTRVTMRLPAELVSKVKQQAEEMDVPYQSLMKLYIKKGPDAGVR